VRTELRPLNLGEILDRTFQIYRTHFQLFAGLATVGAAFTLVWKTIQVFVLRSMSGHGLLSLRYQIVSGAAQLISIFIALIVFSLVMGAMVQAVSAIYLEQPTGISLLLRGLLPRWLRLVLVTVTAFVIAWTPFVLGIMGTALTVPLARRLKSVAAANMATTVYGLLGFAFVVFLPLGIWLSLRYVLANSACAYEGTRIRQSLKRSAVLGKGMRWRLFVLLLVAVVMQLVVGVLINIPVWVSLARAPLHPPLWVVIYSLIGNFIVTVLTSPVAGIGVALFYFDARIRKEGLDIEWSLQPALQPYAESMPVMVSEPDPNVG
jgi:hypothetical protein